MGANTGCYLAKKISWSSLKDFCGASGRLRFNLNCEIAHKELEKGWRNILQLMRRNTFDRETIPVVQKITRSGQLHDVRQFVETTSWCTTNCPPPESINANHCYIFLSREQEWRECSAEMRRRLSMIWFNSIR